MAKPSLDATRESTVSLRPPSFRYGLVLSSYRCHEFRRNSSPRRFCQNSGIEPYRGMLEGENPTRFESEGRRREAKIWALATPGPRDLTEPRGRHQYSAAPTGPRQPVDHGHLPARIGLATAEGVLEGVGKQRPPGAWRAFAWQPSYGADDHSGSRLSAGLLVRFTWSVPSAFIT